MIFHFIVLLVFISFNFHVEILLLPSSFEPFNFLFLFPQLFLFFLSLSFLSFEVQLLIRYLRVVHQIRFGFLEIVLKHTTHSIQLQSLSGIKLLLVLLFLSPLPFLLYLLVKPLLLLLLEELPSRIVL